MRGPSRRRDLYCPLLPARRALKDQIVCSASTQKEYLRLNCRMRGSCAPVIWPKRLDVKLVVGLPRLTRFSALKNSARNSTLWRSENGIGKALKIDKSRSV